MVRLAQPAFASSLARKLCQSACSWKNERSRFPASFAVATFLKESLRGLFIHGRDHAITHGHVFCQRFAWETYFR